MAAGHLDAPRNVCQRMQLETKLVSPRSPDVAAWRNYFAWCHTYMSVTQCKACSGQIGVSVRVVRGKIGNFKLDNYEC